MLQLAADASLDFEASGGSVTVTVTSTDSAGNTAMADATVTVTDVNEAPSVTAADGSVAENAEAAVVGAVAMSDPDAGDTLTATTSDPRFEVVNGMLQLTAGTSLNYEDEQSVTVMVTVTDAAGLEAESEVTVTVTNVNEGPSVTAGDGSVAENAEAAVVGAVAMSDPDAGDTLTATTSDPRFEVVNGMLQLTAGTSLNYEDEQSVTVMVTVTDAGGLEAESEVTVSVTDVNEAPTVTITPGAVVPVKEVTSNSTVAENAMGSTVPPLALIEVTDPDDADSDMLTGALALGATTLSGDGADNFEVILDPLNGLWLALKAGASLDYESTGGSVTVTVTYTDTGGNAKSADATVTVTDANDAPVFAASEYAFDLNENADGSTTAVALGMVSATDEDAGATQTYSITAGNDDGLFAIDAASGAVTYVGTGENYRSLATGAAHTLTVSVSDGTASAEATVAVTVLNVNEAPVFGESAYAFDLGENQDGSTDAVAVGKVSATDPDEGDPITYSITSGNDAGMFAIDHYGNITYTGTGEDAESETTSYELMVNASDGGASSDSMVTVTVTDANDNVPAFVFDEGTTFYTFTLAENTDGSETAAAVGTVSATDPDGDAVTYSIVDDDEDPDNNLFAIDAETGVITYVGTGEDAESATTSYVLTVQASDADAGVRAQATVNVENVNEAPEADAEMAIGTFAFVGGAEGRMEVDLKALFSDPDGDSLTYSLSSGAPDWLHFSVTLKTQTNEAGEEIQTVTGLVYGEPPAGSDMSATVAIVASDGNGAEGHAMFDVVVDAANEAPSAVELRITDADGLIVKIEDTVTVDENDMGAVIGMLTVTDADDARHPHGQHVFTFEVDGEASDQFEVTADGYLKLKDDASLNHETASQITLTVTATDMAVSEPAEGDDPTTASKSQEFTIKVRDAEAGDGPVANDIGDWWVTVDEDLDEDEVDDGDWLSFRLRIQGPDYDNPLDENPAFTEEDNDPLTFSLSDDSPAWLQIDDRGRLTNKAEMLPERGAYTVTVIATDPSGNSAENSFTLAVAISDKGDRDNDRPDVRDVIEYDYTEGTGSRKVAEFTIRDEDLELAPHPYGVHEVELSGKYADRFKLVPLGDDDNNPQTAQYAIHTKSAAELAVDDKGKALRTPIKPIDYETTEEVDITVKVTDGMGLPVGREGESDERDITIDVNDVDDEAPGFSKDSIDDDNLVSVGRDSKTMTTSLEVKQEESSKVVVVLQLSEVWSDPDTDEDDLEFEVGGRAGLPDWITVYGPDEWEDIYDRRSDVKEGDAPEGTRDGDMVVVVVIDRTGTGEDRDNVQSGDDLARFTVTASDDSNNSATETISIDVSDTNVLITENEETPVVKIGGATVTETGYTVTGTGYLTMSFDAGQDPDIADGDAAVLVLYTWSTQDPDTADVMDTPQDESVTVRMVSTSPQNLELDANDDGVNDFLGMNIIAEVAYYEVDPETGTLAVSKTFSAMTEKPVAAPEPGEGDPASVSFDFTTRDEGLVVGVVIANANPTPTEAAAVLQASVTGDGGWITSATGTVTVNAQTGAGSVNLDVNADATLPLGDGGGLYYRVVLTYGPDDDQTEETSSSIQLGDLEDPSEEGTTTGIISGEMPAVGETIRVNTLGETADVQWQARVNEVGTPWMPIEGADEFTLKVTGDQAGKLLRAKVTYRTQEDDTDTEADESTYPTWVEYTEELTVSGDVTNNPPANTQATYEIRVALPATKKVGADTVQPTAVVTDDSIADLFFDSDGNDLTYSILVTPDLDDPALAMEPGTEDELSGGGQVFQTYETVFNTGTSTTARVDEIPEQIFAIDKQTGEVTYITGQSAAHDGATAADGDGNTLAFTISASDGVDGASPRYGCGDGPRERCSVGHCDVLE